MGKDPLADQDGSDCALTLSHTISPPAYEITHARKMRETRKTGKKPTVTRRTSDTIDGSIADPSRWATAAFRHRCSGGDDDDDDDAREMATTLRADRDTDSSPVGIPIPRSDTQVLSHVRVRIEYAFGARV